MANRNSALAAALLVAGISCVSAARASEYEVIELAPTVERACAGCPLTSTSARSLNTRGQAVGFELVVPIGSPQRYHALRWRDPAQPPEILATVTDGEDAQAFGISEAGDAAGYGQIVVGEYDLYPHRWDSRGGMEVLPTPSCSGRRAGPPPTGAYGISVSGTIVGEWRAPDQDPTKDCVFTRPIIWDRSGGFEFLDPAVRGRANAASPGGVVVGFGAPDSSPTPSRSFRWTRKDGVSFLNDLGLGGQATAINARDQIVGRIEVAAPPTRIANAATWSPTGELQQLPRLNTLARCIAMGINDYSNVVGICTNASLIPSQSFAASRAVIWQDGAVQDLNDLIPADSGVILRFGEDINNAGQVLAIGTNSSGAQRAFLLVPISRGR